MPIVDAGAGETSTPDAMPDASTDAMPDAGSDPCDTVACPDGFECQAQGATAACTELPPAPGPCDNVMCGEGMLCEADDDGITATCIEEIPEDVFVDPCEASACPFGCYVDLFNEAVCVEQDTVSALPDTLDLVIAEGTVSNTAWDAIGAPDPFVRVYLNGNWIGDTATDSNTRYPTWNTYFREWLQEGDEFELQLWDEDASAHDKIFSCTFSVTVFTPILEEMSCSSTAGSSMSFYFRYPE